MSNNLISSALTTPPTGFVARLLERRRMLMNKPSKALEYIQDGLVFHLDGADATASQWVDKIGGKVFTMHNITLNGNGGVTFAGNSSSYGKNASTYNYMYNACTIEVVCTINDNGNSECIIATTANGTICFGKYNYRFFTGNGIQQYNWSVGKLGGLHTYSSHAGKFYKDMVETTVKNNDSFGASSGGTYLGLKSSSGNYPYAGTVYQIRIYNRKLTSDEILYNQAIDMKKYNIT